MMKIVIVAIICFMCTRVGAQEIFIRTHSSDMLRIVSDSLRDDYNSKIARRDTRLIGTLNTKIIYNETDTFQLFDPQEKAIALFLLRDFQLLLTDVLKSNDFHQALYLKEGRNSYRYPRGYFENNLLQFLPDLEKESNAINASIRQSALMDDEKDFLEMYLYSILAYTDLKEFDTEQMKSYAENFLERYPSSYFVPYVNNVLLVDLRTSDFGFGAGFFTGFNFLSGNISSYFKSYLPLGLNVELGYKNLLLKGEVSSSFSKLTNESFEYKNITWSSDSTPYILSGNINIAYRVLNAPRYKIAPFAGFGSHAINLSEKADKLLFRPGFQAGVDFDWQFAEANNYADYYDAFSSIKNYTSWYLRVRLGYAQYRNDDTRFNGSMVFTRIAVGFYSNPAMRINKKIKKE